MTFLNESAATMPVGVLAAYDKLMYNLNNLHSELKLSSNNRNAVVILFCEVSHHLMDETTSIYLIIKISHDARTSYNEINVNDLITEMTSEYLYRAESQYSNQSRASRRS